MQNHREVGLPEEGVHTHELVIVRRRFARNVVADRREVAVAIAIVRRSAKRIDTHRAAARAIPPRERCRRGSRNRPRAALNRLRRRDTTFRPGNRAIRNRDRLRPAFRRIHTILQPQCLTKAEAVAQRQVAVENPLEAEGVEVFLRDFDEARLNLNELRLATQLVQHLLELREVLARVTDIEFAERLDVLD